MDDSYVAHMYGTARLEPDAPVVAGAYGTWRLVYTVGEYGFDDGGTIKIAWRFATDWGFPQTEDPAAPEYLTVTTNGPGSLRAQFDTKGGVRPWRKCLIIDVFEDGLRPGDEVVVTYGDTSGGSPGSRAQTFCEDTFEFRVLVNPIATGEFTRLPDSPEIRIVSGPAAKLVCVLPTDAAIGQPVDLFIKAEDAWGNPSRGYAGTVTLRQEGTVLAGLPGQYSFSGSEGGMASIRVTVAEEGVARVLLGDDDLDIAATSNPLIAGREPSPLRHFWGDLHGQTEATVGTNTIRDYFDFARDAARMDFCCHQGNDFQVTKADWLETQEEVRHANDPGRFIAFLGYEWSGNTGVGGDHNVIYLRDDERIHRSSHALVGDKSDEYLDREIIEKLHDEMRAKDALVIPHVGGRRADLSRLDPEVVRLVEVYSAWGMFEWMLETPLKAGHKVGVVANSDGHKCRPGASYPGATTFGVYGGLTCVLAPELTRDALFQALKARQCYATTGERIALQFTCNGHPMGSQIVTSDPPTLEVSAAGTAGIESIELLRCVQGDDARIETVSVYEPDVPLSESRFRVAWGGARIYGRDRKTIWQGKLSVDGATIEDFAPWGLDSPEESVTRSGGHALDFDCITCGDQDGVTIELSDPGQAILRFVSAPCSFEVCLSDVTREPHRVAAGGVDQHVQVTRLFQHEPPVQAELRHEDAGAPAGDLAYWVRLRQTNGAVAWSSPVFVRRD